MGRAISGTNVKVDGQAGPLGKGMPLTEAAGPGGAIPTLLGNQGDGQQGEGLQSENPFAKIYQQKTGKQLPANFKGGIFGRVFAAAQKKRQERMAALGRYKDFNDFYKKRSIGHTFGLKPNPENTKLFSGLFNQQTQQPAPLAQPIQPVQPTQSTGATPSQLNAPPTGGLVQRDLVNKPILAGGVFANR